MSQNSEVIARHSQTFHTSPTALPGPPVKSELFLTFENIFILEKNRDFNVLSRIASMQC